MDRSLATLAALVAKQPQSANARFEYGKALLARSGWQMEDAEARKCVLDAERTIEQAQRDYFDPVACQIHRAMCCQILAVHDWNERPLDSLAQGDRGSKILTHDLPESHRNRLIVLRTLGSINNAASLAERQLYRTSKDRAHLRNAGEYLDRAYRIRKQLWEDRPLHVRCTTEYIVSLTNLARLREDEGRDADALALFQEARRTYEDQLRGMELMFGLKQSYATVYCSLSKYSCRSSKHAESQAFLRSALQLVNDLVPRLIEVANSAAICSMIARKAKNSASRDLEIYGDLAIEALKQAAAHGYRDFDKLARESRFEGIRERPDFQELLKLKK
jgi:hypothetical protein